MTEIDLRDAHQRAPDVGSLIHELESSDIVRVEGPFGGGQTPKGQEILERIVANGKSENVKMLTLRVANTSQAEVIAAGLMVIASGGMEGGAIEVFRGQLTDASAIGLGPDALH